MAKKQHKLRIKGPAGAIETIILLHLMQEGYIVPTLNLEEVDERCAMIRHSREVRDCPVRIAVVQNFAFGGVNTNLFLKKPD